MLAQTTPTAEEILLAFKGMENRALTAELLNKLLNKAELLNSGPCSEAVRAAASKKG